MKGVRFAILVVTAAVVFGVFGKGNGLHDLTFPAPEQWRTTIDPLRYGSPGEVVLKAGFAGRPMVIDYDGDGDLDILIASRGYPRQWGTWFFENPTAKGKTDLDPLFKKPVCIRNKNGTQVSYLDDGRIVYTRGRSYTYDFCGKNQYRDFVGLPSNVHTNNPRDNVWRMADLNGDGKPDIVVGVGDWSTYGWDNRWNASGDWTAGALHGVFYFIPNETGADNKERWGVPRLLTLANGDPIDVYGGPAPLFADFDFDGDLDLVTSDFLDGFYFFENIGSRTEPRFARALPLMDSVFRPIKADLCMTFSTVVDWDGDGNMDIVFCEEDSRCAWIRNTGRMNAGTIICEQPKYFRAERDLLHFGILSTPFAVDIDDDGDEDIVTGNSAGYLAVFENMSGRGVAEPEWDGPKYVCREGVPIRFIAGYNGSVQGPAEAKWGYTCLSVADWDGDGLKDIMVNTTRGEIVWCRNVGTRKRPSFDWPQPIVVEWNGPQPEMKYGWRKPFGSKNLLTQWRTTPYMIDWDGDGLVDLVMSDVDGVLSLFRRTRKDGKLVLLPPERVFLTDEGKPMVFTGWEGHGGIGGNTGRRKFCFLDWDGDGRLDIVMNSQSVRFYRQVRNSSGKWYFKEEGDLIYKMEKGARVPEKMAGHSSCPTACDFDGNGIPDLLIGTEDGCFYLAANPRAKKK